MRTMLDDISQGGRIVVLRSNEEATPAQAAQIMDVTHEFIDRLLTNGVLPFRRLPDGNEIRVKVCDVLALAAE
jgi:excisionase family DNA binding protein